MRWPSKQLRCKKCGVELGVPHPETCPKCGIPLSEENLWSEFKAWEHRRSAGEIQFILRTGIFTFGTAVAAMSCLAVALRGKNNPWDFVFAAWAGWFSGGIKAWIHWHVAEKKFLQEEKKKEERVSSL